MIRFIGAYDINTGDRVECDAKLVSHPTIATEIMQVTNGKYIHTIPVKHCTIDTTQDDYTILRILTYESTKYYFKHTYLD